MGAITRRSLVAGSMGAFALLAAGSLPGFGHAYADVDGEAASSSIAIGSGGDPDAQYGFLMNVQRCIDCGKCVTACRNANGTPDSLPARRHIESYEDGQGIVRHISTSCMQCEKPACATVCPAGAISKGEGGVVRVDKEKCIGCKYCAQACPFGAPHYDATSMYKCDCCIGADVPLGDTPYCVRACKAQALRYGKLDDLLALSDRVVRVQGPTDPSAVLV